MATQIVDAEISIVMDDSQGDPAVDYDTLRQMARVRGQETANSWFVEEASRIRTENTERLVKLMDMLHQTCVQRVRDTMIAEPSLRANKANPSLSALIDEVADLRSESSIRDGVMVAFGRYDDTRQQALSSVLFIMRKQILEARIRASEIESQVSAVNLVHGQFEPIVPQV